VNRLGSKTVSLFIKFRNSCNSEANPPTPGQNSYRRHESRSREKKKTKLAPLLGYGENTTAHKSYVHNLSHLCSESGGPFREIVGGYEYTYTNYTECLKLEEIQQ